MQPSEMAEIARPHATWSDKMRALDAAGVPRAEIARFLGKRYQHVRNVLLAPPPRDRGADLGAGPAGPGPIHQHQVPADHSTDQREGGLFRLVVRDDGAVILPQAVLKALGAAPGDAIMGRLTDETFALTGGQTALRQARALVRGLISPGVNLADDLIAERRRDAGQEKAHG